MGLSILVEKLKLTHMKCQKRPQGWPIIKCQVGLHRLVRGILAEKNPTKGHVVNGQRQTDLIILIEYLD